MTGFAVRVTPPSKRAPDGARAFIVNYRILGRERRYTIAAYPDWSVAAARDEAKAPRRRTDRGEDPMGERHEERTAPTVEGLIRRYTEEQLPKKRESTQAEYRLMIDRIIRPKLGRWKVAEVRHSDINALHRSRKDTPLPRQA